MSRETRTRSSHPWLPYGIYAKVTGAVTLLLSIIGLVALIGNLGGRIPAFICLPVAEPLELKASTRLLKYYMKT